MVDGTLNESLRFVIDNHRRGGEGKDDRREWEDGMSIIYLSLTAEEEEGEGEMILRWVDGREGEKESAQGPGGGVVMWCHLAHGIIADMFSEVNLNRRRRVGGGLEF